MRSNQNLFLLLALGGAITAAPALAESSDYPPACEGSKVSKGDGDRAHTVFLSGKQFLEESNYDKAISYFKDAYSIDCSVHGMLPIIATAYERKGDKAEAVRALEEYLIRAPNASDHDVIERRIRNLKDQLARDQAASASASAAAAAAPAGTSPPAPAPSAEPTAAVQPIPPSVSPSPSGVEHGAAPWVVTGVGAAVVVTGAVLYGVGASDVSSAESKCPPPKHLCGPGATAALDQGNRGRSLAGLGGVLIGGGVAAVAAGLLWHFLEKPADHGGGGTPAAGLRVTPVVGSGYAGASLTGPF